MVDSVNIPYYQNLVRVLVEIVESGVRGDLLITEALNKQGLRTVNGRVFSPASFRQTVERITRDAASIGGGASQLLKLFEKQKAEQGSESDPSKQEIYKRVFDVAGRRVLGRMETESLLQAEDPLVLTLGKALEDSGVSLVQGMESLSAHDGSNLGRIRIANLTEIGILRAVGDDEPLISVIQTLNKRVGGYGQPWTPERLFVIAVAGSVPIPIEKWRDVFVDFDNRPRDLTAGVGRWAGHRVVGWHSPKA
jgi:hypothetical protein